MASINLSLAVVVAFFSGLGLLVMGTAGEDECGFLCVDGTYVSCANYPGQQFPGCQCICGPRDGHDCFVHGPDGSAEKCPK
ncbi:hypothetical protein BS78_06G229500 [Paspalum vaginatum]|nr:hypothetical protein BS78_06G229500 [Paspalum vaginatum]